MFSRQTLLRSWKSISEQSRAAKKREREFIKQKDPLQTLRGAAARERKATAQEGASGADYEGI